MTKVGRRKKGAPEAPLVFWDGYGLENAHSGISVHGQRLSQALSRLDVTPRVICPKSLPSAFDGIEQIIVPLPALVASNKLLWPMTSYLTALNQLRSKSGKAIFHGLSNLNLPVISLPSPRLRFVLTVHDLIPLLPRAKVSLAYRLQFQAAFSRNLERADAVICVSEWTRDTLLQRFPASEAKILVIPNGLELSSFTHETKDESKSILKIISIGRMENYKRYPFLLEIVRQAKGRLRLVLVTDAAGVKLLQKEAKDLLGRGLVRLKTNLSEAQKTRELAAADVYVQTSLYEGFCLPAAEAMAQGLPIVYCHGSGIDEVCDVDCDQGLGDDAPAGDWIEAIFAKYQFSTKRDFQIARVQQAEQSTNWKDAAAATKSLYNELLG